jgi:hypothetical protein
LTVVGSALGQPRLPTLVVLLLFQLLFFILLDLLWTHHAQADLVDLVLAMLFDSRYRVRKGVMDVSGDEVHFFVL